MNLSYHAFGFILLFWYLVSCSILVSVYKESCFILLVKYEPKAETNIPCRDVRYLGLIVYDNKCAS